MDDFRDHMVRKEHVASAVARYVRRPMGLAVPRRRLRCHVDGHRLYLDTKANLTLASFKLSGSGRLVREPPSASVQEIATELMSIYGADTPLGSLPDSECCPNGLLRRLTAMLFHPDWIEAHQEEFAETPLSTFLHTITSWVAEDAIKDGRELFE